MRVSQHDVHFLDRIIKPFGSTVFVLLIAVFSILSGICLSFHSSDWTWFSRFGSVITVCGLLLVSSPIFDKGIYRSQGQHFKLMSCDESGHPRTTNAESRKSGNKILIGILISFIGTLVWGFGDLLALIISSQ